MDGKRFDDVAVLLSRTAGRRRVIRGVLGAVLGGGAMVASLEEASATKPLRGRPYRSTCTADRQCRTPLVCRRDTSLSRLDRNRCGCPDGLGFCEGSCIEFGSEEHCLFCGDACGNNERCCAGGGGCTEIGTIDACADCGDVCDPLVSDVCFEENGEFFCACGVNGEICDSDTEVCCDGVCADLTSDRLNCGVCGKVCDVACYASECHGVFDLRNAALDADGNGYTLCNLYEGTIAASVSCTANAECEGIFPECSATDLCVCLAETTYRGNNDQYVAPFDTCMIIELVNENLQCPT